MQQVATLTERRKYFIEEAENLTSVDFISGNKANRSRINMLKAKADELQLAINYLSSGATEEFINKEIARLQNRIDGFMKTYIPLDNTRFSEAQCNKHLRKYENDMGIDKCRKQIKFLKFLISNESA